MLLVLVARTDLLFVGSKTTLKDELVDVFFTMTVYQVPLGSTFTGTTVCTVKTKLVTHYNNESSMWCVTGM